MPKLLRTILLLAVLQLPFAACTKDSDDNDSGSSSNSCSLLGLKSMTRIFNGDTCDQDDRSAVVILVSAVREGGVLVAGSLCTASLITSEAILTSAHCFTEISREAGSALEGFYVIVGGKEGESYVVDEVALHPGYNGQVASRYDIAVARLTGSVSGVKTLPLLTSKVVIEGDEITAFGYGTNNDQEAGELKAATFTIDLVQAGNILVAEGSNGSSICQGDSGGPAVYDLNGDPAIVGLNSFGEASGCVEDAAVAFGFADLQSQEVLNFVKAEAPGVQFK